MAEAMKEGGTLFPDFSFDNPGIYTEGTKKSDNCHIFCYGNITLCLACKEIITENLLDSTSLIANHLLNEKHSENIQSLFKICFSGPFSESRDVQYLDTVNNSDFHMSNLSNVKSCYVKSEGNLILCLICQEVFSASTSDDVVVKDIFDHLNKDCHKTNLRNNVDWICYIREPQDFLIFNRSFLHCSSCNERTSISADEILLAMIASHIQKKHLGNLRDPSTMLEENGFSLFVNGVKNKSEEHFYLESGSGNNSDNNQEIEQIESNNGIHVINNDVDDLSKDIISTGKNVKNKKVQRLKANATKNELTSVLRRVKKKGLALVLNKRYIIEKDYNFFCLVCEESVKFTENGSELRSHCYSLDHNRILIENATKYVSKNKVSNRKICQNDLEFELVLNTYTEDILLSSHMIFIDYNTDSFICTLCNVSVKFTPCGKYVKSHFFCVTHREKCYKLNVDHPKASSNNGYFENVKTITDGYEIESDESENESGDDMDVLFDYSKTVPQSSCYNSVSQFSSSVPKDYNPTGTSSNNTCSENTEKDTESESDDSLECLSDLMIGDKILCPKCKETVEVFNENVQFSLQLHMQRHRDLSTITDCQGLYYQHNGDYMCNICQKTVPIINKDVELSFIHHIQNVHKNIDFAKVSEEKLSEIISSLPNYDDLQNLISLEDNTVFCNLCNCTVSLTDNLDTLREDLNKHLEDPYHSEQIKAFNKNLQSSIQNPETNDCYHFDEFEGFETIVEKHPVIKDNLKYINKRHGNYQCTLCNTTIPYSKSFHIFIIHLNIHVKGKQHKLCKSSTEKRNDDTKTFLDKENTDKPNNDTEKLVNKKNPDKTDAWLSAIQAVSCIELKLENMLVKLSNKSIIINLNRQFIDVKGGQLYCKVCDKLINVDKLGSKIESHCKSAAHDGKLSKCAQGLRAAFKKIGVVTDSVDVSDEIKARWAEIRKTYPFCKMKSLMLIINKKKDFLQCLLCCQVFYKKKHLIGHFLSTRHREGSVILNCDNDIDMVVQRYTNTLNEQNKEASTRLTNLKTKYCLVFENKENIMVQDGMYYCKICQESIISSNSGRLLLLHLETHPVTSKGKMC